MSILDAYRVQKAEQQSIRELAQLPQQLIIQMAQRGDIPADVAPVVISEKARLVEEAERMRALLAQQAQGGQQSTLMEKGMATIAKAENPQGIAQVAPQAPQAPQGIPGVVNTPETQMAGITGLPTGQMFNEQNFAGGGIVAFAGEGRSDVDLNEIISQQQRQDPSFAGLVSQAEGEAEPAGPRRKYSSLADALKDVQALTGPMREMSAQEIALQEYLTKSKPRTEAEAAQSGWMRALEAGLGIMGGTSPYALTNIGKGAESAVKGFAEDVKERRRGELSTLAAAAQQSRQKRLEGIEDVKSAQHLLEKQEEAEYRQAVLNKDTDLRDTTKIYFNELVAGGADPKDPATMAKARRMAYQDVGLAYKKLEQRSSEEEADRSKSALAATEKELAKDHQYRILSAKALGGATPEEKAKRQADVDAHALKALNKNRAAVSLPPLTAYPGSTAEPKASEVPTAPKAQAKGTPPDLSKVQGVPAGSKIGKLTAQGWEVMNKEGKVIGHIKE